MSDLESDVPCDGCTACCHHQLVTIQPDDGDPRQWRTSAARNPLTGGMERALRLQPDGSCHYLRDGACSIYARRPVMCRAFDCRGMVRMLGALEALKLAAQGDPVTKAGLSRLDSREAA